MKNTVCLWYDQDALAAAEFYARTFPDSSVGKIFHAPNDNPSCQEGNILTVQFQVMGIPCVGLNGGPAFKQSEAFSFQVLTESQAETDLYWNAILEAGGSESHCGWCKDPWGVSWQITPKVLLDALSGPHAKKAFDAMLTMNKINHQSILDAISSSHEN